MTPKRNLKGKFPTYGTRVERGSLVEVNRVIGRFKGKKKMNFHYRLKSVFEK